MAGKANKALPALGALLACLYLGYLLRLLLGEPSALGWALIALASIGICAGALTLKKRFWRLPSLKADMRAAVLAVCVLAALYLRDLCLPVREGMPLPVKILLCAGAGIALDFLLLRLLEILEARTGHIRLSHFLFTAFYGGVYVLLFTSTEAIQPTVLTKLLLAILTAASAVLSCRSFDQARMRKYRPRSVAVALLLLSLYASLASFGQRFFLDGDTRMHFSAPGLFLCALGTIWFLPLIWTGLYLLERASDRSPAPERTVKDRRRARWRLFGCLAAAQTILLLAFWPGSFPEDAANQLIEAAGIAPLNDWHPVLNTLFQRAILRLFGHPGMIVVVQMVLFVWLLTAFLMVGWDRGVSLKWLCLGGCVFVLLPNQALSWTNAMKDYPFTLSLLWGTYLLLQLVLDTPWSRKVSFCLCLGLDLFCMACLRHNGMVPFLFVGVLCVYLTLRRFHQVRFRAIAAFGGALLSIVIFKGPVYKALDVIPNIQSTYTTMLCAVGSYINKDLPLSEDAQKIMESVLPLEDWRDYYSRYEGHDVYYWGRPEGSVPYDTSGVTASDAFRVYLEALYRAPDVVIKDRLDGMDILWDVTMPPDSFNGNNFDYIYAFEDLPESLSLAGLKTEDGNKYYKQNAIARWYHRTETLPINGAGNILLWRTGAYLIAFLVLVVFWWRTGMGRMAWAALPMLGNVAASILILYHQSFRYVYFIQLTVLALLFLSVVLRTCSPSSAAGKDARTATDKQDRKR